MMPLKRKIELNKQMTRAYIDHNKSLTSYATFKVHNKDLGQDLVQDTFIKTWAYLVKGEKVVLMRAFLYHILNNLIIDEYRKRKHQASSLDTLLEKGFEPGEETSERSLDVLDGKIAFSLMKQLPEKYRDVMNLKYEKHFSLTEMSNILSQTKNSIAVRLHRGLLKLRILYKTT